MSADSDSKYQRGEIEKLRLKRTLFLKVIVNNLNKNNFALQIILVNLPMRYI